MSRTQRVVDIRTGEAVTVDLCDGMPIGGGHCANDPVATVTVGPLLACQRSVGETERGPFTVLRLCADHVTPFMDRTEAYICCAPASLDLRWDR